MATINQPTANPTNKLTAATMAAAAASVIGLVLRNMAPEWYDPEVNAAMLPVLIYAIGWLTPDNPNTVVVVRASDTDA